MATNRNTCIYQYEEFTHFYEMKFLFSILLSQIKRNLHFKVSTDVVFGRWGQQKYCSTEYQHFTWQIFSVSNSCPFTHPDVLAFIWCFDSVYLMGVISVSASVTSALVSSGLRINKCNTELTTTSILLLQEHLSKYKSANLKTLTKPEFTKSSSTTQALKKRNNQAECLSLGKE